MVWKQGDNFQFSFNRDILTGGVQEEEVDIDDIASPVDFQFSFNRDILTGVWCSVLLFLFFLYGGLLF